MKNLKIKFVDFWSGFNINSNFIVDTLSIKYKVIQTDNPDYLFFSCFGTSHLSYNCVKILFLGENLTPDFNICDYALGFDYLDFSDRYMRLPLYVTYDSFKKLKETKYIDEERLLNRKFCSIVVSNHKAADPTRERFFRLLSEYKNVDSGGKSWNNVGGPVKDKYKFISEYKFNIAFENSSVLGYTTEKIMEPMTVNSIPIYWGNPLIDKDFNSNSFLNAHNYKSLEALVNHVVELDSCDEQYLNMLKKPWIIDEQYLNWKTFLLNFLSNIIEKPLQNAKYLIPYGGLGKYHEEMKTLDHFLSKSGMKSAVLFYMRIVSKLKSSE